MLLEAWHVNIAFMMLYFVILSQFSVYVNVSQHLNETV